MPKTKRKMTLPSLYYFLVGHRSRPNYWTCSNFAGWIRKQTGVEAKPKSATSEGWCNWHRNNHKKFGYWLAEEGLDILQDIWLFFPDWYRNVRRYVRNRFIDRTHLLNTKLEKGQYHEFDTRLLYGMFEALVDFVEDEKAAMMRWTSDKDLKLPNAAAGVAYFEWERNLVNDDPEEPGYQSKTRQAKYAEETLELYFWWTEVRPYRKEPGEAVGLWEWEDKHRPAREDDEPISCRFHRDLPEDLEKERRALYDASDKVETDQYNEDSEMMTRLVELRKALWT